MSKPRSLVCNEFGVSDLLRKIIFSWLFAALTEYLILPRDLRNLAALDGLARMSFARVIVIACGIFAILNAVSAFVKSKKAERWAIVIAFVLLAVTAVSASPTRAFFGVLALIVGILIVYAIYDRDKTPEIISDSLKTHKAYIWITAGLAAAFFLFVAAWTVGRVYSFSTPTYDFGIFSQMFYSMKETGLPVTTLERDGLLSHFDVHVSPIYYLMLPFYCLFPSPATLQILQAAVLASAVIPLWKIGKCHGLTGPQRTLICAVLFLYPAYSGGTSYDLHENCFLASLILWLFYGIDKKNTAIIAVTAILTLSVKEDAAVYVAVIALWLIVKTLLQAGKKDVKNLITGTVLLAVSLMWFFLVTGYLAESGDGVMTNRYKNFMYDGSASLITVVKAVILSPMKALYECVDAEKLNFIALTMLPLLGLPLFTRKYERYILLIPYILVNLMPDYVYQHNIFFQYTFGSVAFLIYLTVVNLADFKVDRRRTYFLIAAALIGATCFVNTVIPKAVRYPTNAMKNYEYYQSIRDILNTVPDGASVAATTFYTTYLSERETLYDVNYASKEHLLETEYVVLKMNANSECRKYATKGKENGFENLTRLLEDNGYVEYNTLDDILVIYRKESYID